MPLKFEKHDIQSSFYEPGVLVDLLDNTSNESFYVDQSKLNQPRHRETPPMSPDYPSHFMLTHFCYRSLIAAQRATMLPR